MDFLSPHIWHKTNLTWTTNIYSSFSPFVLASLNPHWELEQKEKNLFYVKDLLTEKEYEAKINISLWPEKFELELENLVKIEGQKQNNKLEIRYIPYVDDELFLKNFSYWILSIREYYRLFTQINIFNKVWLWLMKSIWLKMSPKQRRISHLIIKATFVEIILIAALIIGYFYFGR
ncbi:MAG TPA: hypothetical protein DIT19_04770 [Desulfonauticus sp.]|jgi:hypothetical protein|nr:MAG: Uncharacterized protein XD41_0834 [Desulfonauticus sp. 38_4375]MDK2922050.1 hypothetical protein [Desulfonauticus sp.]HCO12520.1 hypothetical protein [Desulfonauticus sp.]